MQQPFMKRLNPISMPYGYLQLFAGDPPGGGGGGDDPVTYTEEQVQAKIKEATGTAIEKAIKDRFGDLAGMDLKEVRAAIALKKKADEEAASKSKNKDKDGDDKGIAPEDVEKLLDQRLKEREKEQNEKTFKRLLAADVKVLAAELGFADWEDAHALADLSKVKEDDKGNLTGVKEALEELLKKKPHLGKQKPGSGAFGANVGGGSGGGSDKKDRLERMKKLAQGAGTTAPAAHDPWKR